MALVRDVAELRLQVAAARAAGKRIALVPTMGALHQGHLSLVALARANAGFVVASLFVNPAQFGPNEDFARYPRDEKRDRDLLQQAGCDLLFAPSVATVYPAGFRTQVTVADLSERLEGKARPGHFAGVATVVTKLFGMVQPDVAIFGEKDWQQLAIIRQLTADLNLAVEIRSGPTVREADGLAMSSRNAYLTPTEREVAGALPDALAKAAAAIASGREVSDALAEAERAMRTAGFTAVDYVALVDPETLAPLLVLDRPARLLAAARLGTTRLIDNLEVRPEPDGCHE
ncbi:pantoate--beta-alanine ligase [Thermaurantiacus sp.]